jgi:hypothetical protein
MNQRPIAVEIIPYPDDHEKLRAVRSSDDVELIAHVPRLWLSLLPFMVVTLLVEKKFDTNRLLVVKLRGADFVLCSDALGVMAANPIPNRANPISHAAYEYGHANVARAH